MTSVLSSSGVGGVTGDMTIDEPDFVSSSPVIVETGVGRITFVGRVDFSSES